MEVKMLFRKTIKNWPGIIFFMALAGIMAWLMTGDISEMQAATTNYHYYKNFIYLIDNIARTYFFCVFFSMVILTYVHKQYSKWCVRLFYLVGLSALAYFAFAGVFIKHVYGLMESAYMDEFPQMAHRLYTGPLYWILVGYFFTPKILKDARRLKEEQELTV